MLVFYVIKRVKYDLKYIFQLNKICIVTFMLRK